MITRLTITILVLAASTHAHAWQGLTPANPTWEGGEVAWNLHDQGSDDLPFATVQADVRRGMEDWTTVGCTGLSTTYQGTTPSGPATGDGQFTVGWVESGWRHSSSAIGVTATRLTTNRIIEADMEMNGVHFTWTTDPGSGGAVNLYSIALHEGGHFMGLGHSSDPSAAMYFAYSGGISAIGADDEAGICALYPGMGGGVTDCTTTGCPTGESCVDGACVPDGSPPPSGGGEVCASCTAHGDCGGSGDYCLGYPDGLGYCGAACVSSAGCGPDEQCLTLANGARQCVRFSGGEPSCAAGGPPPPEPSCTVDTDCATGMRCDAGACVPAGPGTGAGLGETCVAHEDCASGACLAGVCTQTCAWPGGSCPGGFYCDGGATGACGDGVCLAGGPGAGAEGDACSADADCASTYCFRGQCRAPCAPDVVGSCSDGRTCQVGDLPCRGACGVTGRLGDRCGDNAECASGLCASRGGDGYCTQLCDVSTPCGPGHRCETDGVVPVCVPDGAALGETCGGNGDCASGICGLEAERSYCTRVCDAASPCPIGMGCVQSDMDGVAVCRPGDDRGDNTVRGACSVSAASGPGGGAWGLLALCAIGWRARRASRRARRRIERRG